MSMLGSILFAGEGQKYQMKVKPAELGHAMCGMIAMVTPGCDAGHVALQPCSPCPLAVAVSYIQS